MAPNDLWFKRKAFGWGWTPANGKGWTVVIVFILATLVYPLGMLANQRIPEPGTVIGVGLALTAVLVVICIVKGEKPRWQWGPDEKPKKKS